MNLPFKALLLPFIVLLIVVPNFTTMYGGMVVSNISELSFEKENFIRHVRTKALDEMESAVEPNLSKHRIYYIKDDNVNILRNNLISSYTNYLNNNRFYLGNDTGDSKYTATPPKLSVKVYQGEVKKISEDEWGNEVYESTKYANGKYKMPYVNVKWSFQLWGSKQRGPITININETITLSDPIEK